MKYLIILLLSCVGFIQAENVTKKEPISLEKKLESGKILSLKQLDPNNKNLFYFKLSGFKPKENVTITSNSCEEEIILKMITNENGEIVSSLDPKIGERTGGKAFLEVKTQNNETLHLDFNWGDKIK